MDFTYLRQDPKFRKLSYPMQQQVVGAILKRNLEKDPNFMKLDPIMKQKVSEQLWTRDVLKWKPALNAYDGNLTDQDREALARGFLADVPGTQDSYKRALWLRERMEAGDARAADEARGWIVRNSVGTKSLLVQAAAGVKDAAETLFGGDPLFNDLRLNSQDYQKLSDYLLSAMPRGKAQSTQTAATTVGMATAMVENVGLNIILGGSLSAPGLFTKGLWSKVKALNDAEKLAGTVGVMTALRAPLMTGLTGGVIDVTRSFPRLIETGLVQGPAKAFSDMALTFGEGFAFDFAFQAAKTAFKFTAFPIKKAFQFVDPTDTDSVKRVAQALQELDEGRFGKTLTGILNGTVPQELMDQLPKELQEKFTKEIARVQSLLQNPSLDFDTPDGFRKLAYAMGGWDVGMDPSGAVKIFDPDGLLIHSWGSRREAFSWMLARGWKGADEVTDLSKVLAGAQPFSRVKVYGTTNVNVADLPDEHLYQMARFTPFRGDLDQNTFTKSIQELSRRSKFQRPTVQYVDEATFQQGMKFRQTWTPDQPIVMPKAITMPDTQRLVDQYLDPIFERITPVRVKYDYSRQPLTVDALDSAVSRFGGRVKGVPGKYELQLPGQAPIQYSEIGTLNRDVWRAMLANEVVDEETFGRLLHRSTGYNLVSKVDEATGIPTFEIRANGKLVQAANSLPELSESAVLYNLRLPEDLMPEMIVGRNGNLMISNSVATGSPQSLLRFMKNFSQSGSRTVKKVDILSRVKKGTSTKRVLADGSEVEFTFMPGRKIVFEDPTSGTIRTFDDNKGLTDFLETMDGTWRQIDELAHSKGYRATPVPNGQVLFHDTTGKVYMTNSYDEAKEFLAKQADIPLDGPELTPIYGSTIDQELFEKLSKPFDTKLAGEWQNRVRTIDKTSGEHKNFLDRLWRPALNYAKDLSVRYDMPEIARHIEALDVGRRSLSGKMARDVRPMIKSIFTDPTTGKIITNQQAEILSRLAELDESMWETFLKKTSPEFEFTDGLRTVLRRSQDYLKYLGTTFDVDILGFMKNYMGHFRGNSPEAIADALKLGRKGVSQLFSKDIDELPMMQFLSKNARLDSTLNRLQEKNIIKIVEFYAERGYRDVYLKDISDEMATFIRGAKGKLPENSWSTLNDIYGQLVGGVDDPLSRSIASASLSATKNISKGLQKISGLLGGDGTKLGRALEDYAERIVTADLTGELSKGVSMATLGFRWFRALSNTAQYMNTVAIYGKYAVDSPDIVTDSVVKALKERGILDEKIFSAAGEGLTSIKQSISDVAFRPQQATEYVTRAWTAVAAGKAFDDFIPGLRAGNYDFPKFVKLAKFGFLPDSDIQSVKQLLDQGLIDAARDRVMHQSVRELMFDYAKENYPRLFQGTLGRLFGKFGVYPVGQINLYRNIVRGFSDNPGEAFLQVTRLVAVAGLVRNAFLAAGIDYSGFSLTDPFSFSGGPLWSSMIDLTKSVGDSPENQMARRRLAQSWSPIAGGQLNVPRLWFPGGLQISSTLEGIEKIYGGNYWSGILNLTGAPDSREPWTKPVLPF